MKWWFPGRYFGLHHKNSRLDEWKRNRPPGALQAWKRTQDEGKRRQDEGMNRMVQPKYETIVRLGPMRWGMTVRLADGRAVVHELGRVWLEPGF